VYEIRTATNHITNRLLLRVRITEDIPQIIQYFTINKAYLTPFSPTWVDGFFTGEYWQYQIEQISSRINSWQRLKIIYIIPNQPHENYWRCQF
jgi:ribosomal-protein-alanine N-acetyltransferase